MLRLWIGSCQIGTYSIGGIHGVPNTALVTLSTINSDTRPSQNDGVAVPPTANKRTTKSIQVFCLTADTAPSGMAISSEIGSLAQISVVTGLPDHIEVPKSNRMMPHTKSINCTTSGRSMPS